MNFFTIEECGGERIENVDGHQTVILMPLNEWWKSQFWQA